MESEKNLDVPTRHGYLGATKGHDRRGSKHKKKHKEEKDMAKYTNAQIAGSLDLWNEYFNTSALMTDEEFHTLSYDQRLQMLVEAFGADENEENTTMNSTYEEALDILYQFRGDLIPERSWTETMTGTVANRATGMALADDYIALLEGMDDDDDEGRVTVTPIPTGDALEIWREICDASGMSYDAPDVDEWVMIQIRECEAAEMYNGIVTELIVPAHGWY
jgi:hypothetical protein